MLSMDRWSLAQPASHQLMVSRHTGKEAGSADTTLTSRVSAPHACWLCTYEPAACGHERAGQGTRCGSSQALIWRQAYCRAGNVNKEVLGLVPRCTS
jgi:hypothetical protein